MTLADPPVAVICGGGALAPAVVRAAQDSGREVFVIAIKGEADSALDAFHPLSLGWGQIGKMFSSMKAAGCRDVVLIGSVQNRPDFKTILGDLGTMRRLPRIISALVGGDDSLLVKVIALIEEEGFHVIGAHEVAADILVESGLIAGPQLLGDDKRDILLGFEAVRLLGQLDVGQAAVVQNGRVIALEAAEGTDAVLARCAELKAIGRVKWKGRSGVLVKRAKPGQDLRVDLPTIGAQTIAAAAEIGLAGVALEAGRVLIADREETVKQANEKNIFIWGADVTTPRFGDNPELES